MDKQIKVTAIRDNGKTIESGWFKNVNKGEEYATAMLKSGYVIVKQYKTTEK